MAINRLAWVLLPVTAFAGCNAQNRSSTESLTAPRAAAVEQGVRTFMATVAHDVTQEGPAAWSKHFEDGPAFFMAVDGQMAFPSGAAAKEGIQSVALTLKRIDLKWGNDLRVDPLTAELAVVATPWHEIKTDSGGQTTEDGGFFTGLAEYRDGRWQFRDAHWSSRSPRQPHANDCN
jgi:hypothetical protein